MKKLLTLTAVGAIMATSANAATQCVYKPSTSSQNCTVQTLGEAEWEITCDGQTYRGFAMFSYLTDGADTYDVLPEHYFSWGSTSGLANKGTPLTCYCKMTYPVESKWVKRLGSGFFAGNNGGAWNDGLSGLDSCTYWCLDDQGLGDSTSFAVSVNAYLSNLKE
ncbi:MAG: hypothetical protein IKB05_01520 [Alphaproteobacteria bacterium]|nr:hypothetical protein [Alphaproteobacteria bacterium]